MLEIDDINYQAVCEFKEEISGDKPVEEICPPEILVEIELGDFNDEQKNVVADWFIDDTLQTAKLTYKFYPKQDLIRWIEEQRAAINRIPQNDGESDENFEKRKLEFIEFPIDKYGFLLSGGLDTDKQIDFYFLKALKFEFLDALRDAKTQLVASGDYRLLYRILLNRGDGKYSNVKKSIIELANSVSGNTELKLVKDEIEKYLAKTSLVEDDLLNSVNFEFSKPDENEMLKKLSLRYGDSPVTVERNGMGRNNLLYISLILSHLLYKNDYEVKFRVIAVEEPESHLHPHLQEHLSKNIKSESSDEVQLIVTSHCPHITSKLDLENTAILYKSNGKTESCYFLDNFKDADGNLNAQSKKHIGYLQRYLDATKSTMFFSRKLILVEGIAEQIIIPKLFEIYTEGKTLEKVGCGLVNVSGVGFRNFLEVIKRGFFIKCLVLTDSDIETENADRAINLAEDYEENNEIISISISEEGTFEKDIISANRNDLRRDFIFDAIELTRPQKGREFRTKYENNEIDIQECFDLIEGSKSYKAEFAMNLLSTLEENSEGFNIPQYISEGFDFILSE